MKGRIERIGCLQIERAGRMKDQYCPDAAGNRPERCGDWCPKFGEPAIASDGHCVLRFCGGQLIFDKFEDERVK